MDKNYARYCIMLEKIFCLIDPDMLPNDPGWAKKTPVDPWDGVDLHTLVSAAPHANTSDAVL